MTSVSRPAPRQVRRDALLNRLSILQAAVSVLCVDPDAGMDAIAARAGLTRRAVYGHFPTRDHLIEEILATGAARIAASLLPLDDTDPRAAIATIGSRLWGEVSHVRATAVLAVRGPYSARIAEVLRPLREVLERVVTVGVASGSFRQDVPAPILARLIEGTALNVLDEASRLGLNSAEGDRLVVITTLSCAGLGWEDAARYVGAPLPGGPPRRGE
ncbi:TetR/AcrR family transcriptional regulator [Marisediminicola antarctica]|uniref:HTH tetR-type domain-containing protein n=1 Tax=Marisediminicola antarctica TaxID=674079 RepID=A0A7L5AI12_9MICO|nr:TetR/AcrR family transcriptional regulator [Marisediminicola antarctica]QHO68741.1 hypothetical protein BHD05_02895 [Marisediminicola antarctica]